MNIKNLTGKILLFAIITFAAFSLSSCAKKLTFVTSNIVPAATGSVKIKSDNNGNSSINMSIKNLAKPGDLTPPRNTYVVWMVTKENGTKNIGSIKTSSGFLSSKLKSSLKTVTPYKPTAFFITAEDDANVRFANGPTVLRTN